MLIKSLNCVLILSVFIQKRVVFLHHVSAPLGTAILIDSLAVKSKQSWPRTYLTLLPHLPVLLVMSLVQIAKRKMAALSLNQCDENSIEKNAV